MSAHSSHSRTTDERQSPTSRPMIMAMVIGLALGGLFTFLLRGLTGLAALAMWPLAFSVGLLVVGLFNARYRGETSGGMLIGGQLLGGIAIGLLFLASLA